MEVTIYIDVYHTGHLKSGTGSYNIMLEYIDSKGEPNTKEYYEGITGTTKNRTAIKACITALEHMTKTCNIKIVTNSRFVVNAINQNWDKTKNEDLWQQLLQSMSQHNVTFVYDMTNPYSSYMYTQMKKAKIEFKEDTLENYMQQ
jgi:ribonuclease HI